MELNAKLVLEVLKKKGVMSLYHANTVQTACSFLREGRLLSRGSMEERGLTQTSQQTDAKDKEVGVWNDIFLDSVDIHERSKKRNNYGPVLFHLELDFLREDWLGPVWITKCNPQNWHEDAKDDWYFSSVEDLEKDYIKGKFDQMIVLRHVGGVLRLQPTLKEIVVDDPDLPRADKIDLYSQAVGALLASARASDIDNVKITRRVCSNVVKDQYGKMLDSTLLKFFAP